MKIFNKLILLLFLLVVLLGAAAYGQPLDPSLKWQAIESPHFRIIFHQGAEGLAQEAAQVGEDYYEFWTKELGYAPAGKTNMVIIDAQDFPNGFASVFPNNDIWVYTSQVQFASADSSRQPSWNESTILHEYGHIIDLDKVSGISKILRDIFGKEILPNDLKPAFFIEGIATYGEYLKFGDSRATEALSTMYLRQMVLENRFPSLDRAATYYSSSEWPSLVILYYNFGSWFMRYIEERYGKEAIAKIDEANAKSWLPSISYLLADALSRASIPYPPFSNDFGEVLKEALGVSPDELYLGFKDWLKDQFAEKMREVEAEGLTTSFQLTTLGYWTDQPAWSPDGQWIAYQHSDPARMPGIRLIAANGEQDQAIISGVLGDSASIAWAPKGDRIVYSKHDVYKKFYFYADLYLYDLTTGKERRLTWGERAYSPVFTPDGQKIIFAKNQQGDKSPDLAVLDPKTGKISILKKFPNDTVIYSFDLSPDGKQLALSIWKRGGYQDIYLLPTSGGELTPVTQDKAKDLDPSWSPDGQFLLFNSDRSGIGNIYAYRLADGAFFKVTNVISGAYDPEISPDGKQIAFVSYSGAGYNIQVMEFNLAKWKAVSLQKEEIPVWSGFPKTEYPIQRYNPGLSLSPKLWIPIIQLDQDQAGFSTLGEDSLFQHSYSFNAGFNWKQGEPFYSFGYSNAQLFSPISLSISLGKESGGNWQDIELEIPLVERLYSAQELSFGFWRADFDGASYTLSSSWSLFQRSGLDLLRNDLKLEVAGEITKTSENLNGQIILDFRDYLRLPCSRTNILAFKLSAGWSNIEENFSLGGYKGKFLLRGYERGAFKGRQIASGSIEYRFSILSIEHGLGLWPIFLDDLRGSVFIDSGTAGETLELAGLKLGFGEELQLSVVTGYWYDVNLRLGIGQGLGQARPLVYFEIGGETAF